MSLQILLQTGIVSTHSEQTSSVSPGLPAALSELAKKDKYDSWCRSIHGVVLCKVSQGDLCPGDGVAQFLHAQWRSGFSYSQHDRHYIWTQM